MRDPSLDNLLAAFLSEPWTEGALTRRAKAALGRTHRMIRPLVRRILAAFPSITHEDRLRQFVLADATFRHAWGESRPKMAKLFFPSAAMAPHPSASGWHVPPITTDRQLCDLLHIDAHQLEWLADVAGRNHREGSPKLGHYRYRWVSKASGRSRLLEIPKTMLKQIQRRILHLILDRIPSHPAAHGFRPGRSIRTNADPHTGKAMVIRFDLSDFFPSIAATAVTAIFRTAGYPPDIAGKLTGLCTTRLPRQVWGARPNGSDERAERFYLARHLPQGAPTSPALANLAAFHLDQRLQGLCDSLDVAYTRYADDLTCSGGRDLAGRSFKFCACVEQIVRDEGFRLNPAKSRVMPRSVRQTVASVVVNVRPSVSREEIDRLKATLTNCIRLGPASQNRANHPDFRAHLVGKVAHVAHLNPIRGRKLLALFDQIVWRTE